MKMKWIPLLFLVLNTLLLESCSVSRLYFVRHAEKSLEIKTDPPLTAEGVQRSEVLAQLLRNKKISRIYSTETLRTKSTGVPLADKLGIEIRYYGMDTLTKFLFSVLKDERNALIIGHSNTVIRMLEELELKPTIKEIPDQEYDNLYIVSLKPRDGRGGYKMELKETKFGKASPKSPVQERNTMMGYR